MQQSFRSGFIAVIGRTNVGKSTLVNQMVGQKVGIVSPRVQTTRSRIMGIVHRQEAQMVLVDTPGIHGVRNKLGQFMIGQAYGAIDGADGILFVTDATSGIQEEDKQVIARLSKAKVPVLCAINKTDVADSKSIADVMTHLILANLTDLIPISALTGDEVQTLTDKLFAMLPIGPQYFPDDMYTDQPERRIAAEMIREKALTLLKQEVPHGIGVEITKILQKEELTRVEATLYCEREGHKGIIIGKGGLMLKEIGSQARQDLQKLFGMQVHLQLLVKVRQGWRDSPDALKDLEYTQD